jgi:hypothetical protein
MHDQFRRELYDRITTVSSSKARREKPTFFDRPTREPSLDAVIKKRRDRRAEFGLHLWVEVMLVVIRVALRDA